MKPLSIKQEKFCLEYVKDGNASRSYRDVYNTSRMKSESVTEKACIMIKKGNIKARIDELRQEVTNEAIMSIEEIKKWYTKILIDEEQDMKDRLKASELLGKSVAMFTDKHEHSGKVDINTLSERLRGKK